MDDASTKTQQPPVVKQAQSPVVPSVVPSGSQANQPTGPIGGTAKETLTVTSPTKTEWVSPSTPEIVLPKEVKDAGVEAHPIIPEISNEDRVQGVQMGHQNIPVPTVATESLGITTPRGILQQLKSAHKGVKDSLSWLVRLIMKEQDKKEKEAHSASPN